jgi:preprotein translocase subunit YajC
MTLPTKAPVAGSTTEDMKSILASFVKQFYDLQDLRIKAGGRVLAYMHQKMGIDPGQKKDQNLSKEDQRLLKQVEKDYKLLTTGVAAEIKKLDAKVKKVKPTLITNEIAFKIASIYMALIRQEVLVYGEINEFLNHFPIWHQYMSHVTAFGPAMAGILITYVDINKCPYVSNLYKFLGLDVVLYDYDNKELVPNILEADNRGILGEARSRKKHHLIDRKYEDKDGKTKMKKSITYSKFAHDKLLGVLSGNLIRQNSHYREIYHNYKNRISNEPHRQNEIPKLDGKGNTLCYQSDNKKAKVKKGDWIMVAEFPPARLTNMARRYMVKQFIKNLWITWRQIEGLEVNDPIDRQKKEGEDPCYMRHRDPWWSVEDKCCYKHINQPACKTPLLLCTDESGETPKRVKKEDPKSESKKKTKKKTKKKK